MSRRSTGKRIRFEVLQRDQFSCQYCGQIAPHVRIEVDHIVAVADGGDDHPFNLIAACADCNGGKHASRLLVRTAMLLTLRLMARHFDTSFARDVPPDLVEQAFDSEMTINDVREAALRASNWTAFEEQMRLIMGDISMGCFRPLHPMALRTLERAAIRR